MSFGSTSWHADVPKERNGNRSFAAARPLFTYGVRTRSYGVLREHNTTVSTIHRYPKAHPRFIHKLFIRIGELMC
jgi:hypothetical protein